MKVYDIIVEVNCFENGDRTYNLYNRAKTEALTLLKERTKFWQDTRARWDYREALIKLA